jgi:two-component system, sensor histidine kinase
MGDAFRDFFGANGFMPHGMCYLWQPGVLTLHVASDALITMAYFSIPFTLAHFVRRRKDVEINWMIGCFAIFIVACGTTHLMEILTIWHPVYWVSGTIKAITAAASVPTAVLLVRLLPQALRWPSPSALKRANDELRDARDAADRANRAKGLFLATASHDLRQPLQTIALLNGSLRRLGADPDAIHAVTEQEKAIGTMSRVLNALLDISKLESGAISPQIRNFDLTASFEELRIEFSELARNKDLQLEVSQEALVVRSDPTLLGQMLRNLVSNAVRYTQKGAVRVRCEPEGERLCIDVQDTGIGIAQDQLAAIFDDFYQVGVAPNSVREGYGLGLSIVQRAAGLLNHEIRVRSELGRGSTFSILLPAGSAGEVAQTSAPAVSVTASERRARVLVVDDDPGVLNATRMLLKVEGFRVSTADSLEEAIRVSAEQSDIELLITDYHLNDGKTGTDVIDAVRRVIGANLKAVLITGDTTHALKEAIRDDHVRLASKPINADEFLAVLDALLES